MVNIVNRQDVAKRLIEMDLYDMLEAFDKCSQNARVHFMFGGLLYLAMIISGSVDWCNKAGIAVACYVDKELMDKLRAKVKLYSNDDVIPLVDQIVLMQRIINVEKQYWLDLQAQSGIKCPKFLIPDIGTYSINDYFIGNTLGYAYEYSPLNPQGRPIIEVLFGASKEASLSYTLAMQLGQTMQELYTNISGSSYILKNTGDQDISVTARDFRMGNRRFFKQRNAVFALNLYCRINYLLELFLLVSKPKSMLTFRMMYVTFYHLKCDLDNFGLNCVHYNMPYRNKTFRNVMAHYSLFGKIDDNEIIENVVGFGLFEKYFGVPFEVVNQALVDELRKTRDSLGKYVKI